MKDGGLYVTEIYLSLESSSGEIRDLQDASLWHRASRCLGPLYCTLCRASVDEQRVGGRITEVCCTARVRSVQVGDAVAAFESHLRVDISDVCWPGQAPPVM